MITHFKDYTDKNDYSDDPSLIKQLKIDRDFEKNLGTIKRRMMVFENYWNNSVFSEIGSQTVKPYLENIGNLINESVTVQHRFINSKNDLEYYIRKPEGILWDVPESFGTNVWYFGIHGNKEGLKLPQETITKDQLLGLLSGFGDFPNILYFSSCSLFEDGDFGYELLKASGTRGIVGYAKNIGFAMGTIIDLLFLSNFFKYDKGDPFDNLPEIYNCVIEGIPVAKDLGFKLLC